uniref:Uncharacterized protein n=1 Tax=Lygus hesperus TaxID=30085 RepID=A0A0A9W061_LYGHE
METVDMEHSIQHLYQLVSDLDSIFASKEAARVASENQTALHGSTSLVPAYLPTHSQLRTSAHPQICSVSEYMRWIHSRGAPLPFLQLDTTMDEALRELLYNLCMDLHIGSYKVALEGVCGSIDLECGGSTPDTSKAVGLVLVQAPQPTAETIELREVLDMETSTLLNSYFSLNTVNPEVSDTGGAGVATLGRDGIEITDLWYVGPSEFDASEGKNLRDCLLQ